MAAHYPAAELLAAAMLRSGIITMLGIPVLLLDNKTVRAGER